MMIKNSTIDLDDVPPRERHATVRRRQVFQLGRHILGCGGPSFLRPLLDGQQAKACIADPLASDEASGIRPRAPGKRRHAILDLDFSKKVSASLEVMRSESAAGGLAFIFTDFLRVFELGAIGKALEIPLLGMALCMDTNTSPYSDVYALCGVFQTHPARGQANVQPGEERVWSYPLPRSIDAALEDRPIPKPVAMLSQILLDHTKPGDVVIGPYLAHGCALIAAERTGRNYVGVDQDPRSVEAAIMRWQQYTCKDAVDIKSGEPFDDLTLARQP